MTTLRRASTTIAEEARALVGALDTEAATLRWPSPKYEHDLEGFVRDILGFRMWERQKEFAGMLTRSRRVAVKAGHKVSKTFTLVARALHFYCTYGDARVFFMAPIYEQVKDPIWVELRKLVRRSGTCADCRDRGITEPCAHSCPIDGSVKTPKAGLQSADGLRSIVGMATREANNVSGKSGANMLWILDEVIGVDREVFEAVQGTQAGGAWSAIASNPTEYDPTNEFCMAFGKKAELYDTMTMPSTCSPNVTGEMRVPGCATADWINEKRDEWGEDSALYQSRVMGEFPTRGAEQMLSIQDIGRAQIRLDALDDDGVLAFGVDVAGAATGNDSWTLIARRGMKIVHMSKCEGLDSDDGVAMVVALLDGGKLPDGTSVDGGLARPGECPQVAYDASSKVGSDFGKALVQWSRRNPGRIAPRGIVPSADPPHEKYDRMRDYLLANLAEQIIGNPRTKQGLGIPHNEELEEELLALRWDWDRSDKSGRDKVIEKKALRRILGRSPDLADGLSYCVFGIDHDGDRKATPAETQMRAQKAAAIRDPYRRGAPAYNPYAGGR
jgi:phage terminase large subunit